MSDEPIVRFEDVTRVYPLPAGAVVALDHVSLTVEPGEFIAVMGPSGSGKSTLLNLMGCLDVPTTGKIYFAGQDISRLGDDDLTRLRRDHIGFVFQQFNLIPLLSALENVEFPVLLTAGREESRRRATEVLRAMNLDDALFSHRPGELSGGEQQRVAIARALANDPDLLLCDEPTGNLDTKTGTAIMDLLAAENRRGKTIVMVTHDPRMTEYADRTVRIVDGRLA